MRTGEDREYAVHGERLARIDRDDAGVWPRGAHEAGVARVRRKRSVVRELRLAGHQGEVFDPRDRPTDHPGPPAALSWPAFPTHLGHSITVPARA